MALFYLSHALYIILCLSKSCNLIILSFLMLSEECYYHKSEVLFLWLIHRFIFPSRQRRLSNCTPAESHHYYVL